MNKRIIAFIIFLALLVLILSLYYNGVTFLLPINFSFSPVSLLSWIITLITTWLGIDRYLLLEEKHTEINNLNDDLKEKDVELEKNATIAYSLFQYITGHNTIDKEYIIGELQNINGDIKRELKKSQKAVAEKISKVQGDNIKPL